jgi:hypothetical protein
MPFNKNLLVILTAILAVLVIGSGVAKASISRMGAASALQIPHLGKEIVFTERDNEQMLPAAAYNPNRDEYLVVWHNKWGASRDIYAQRVTGTGELLSWFSVESYVPLPTYTNDRAQPSVAYDSTRDRYLVVWAYDVNGDGSNWDIHGIFVNWDGPIDGLHEFVICDWPTSQQWNPKVAYSPVKDEFMIVWWTDHPSVPDYISGRRMNAANGDLSPSDSDFTISNPTWPRINPEIAYNNWRNEYLVVYDDTQDIYGTRYTATGAALKGGEFAIAGWPGQEILPSVAYCLDYDQYLVAWQNPQPDIYARFVSGEGINSIVLHLESTSVAEINPIVACNQAGTQFMVTWQQQFSSATGPYGVHGQFVNTDMTLGSFFAIKSPTATIAAEFTNPLVVGGGVNFLTVWEHDRAGTALQDIHGRLISPYAQFLPLALGN